MIVPSKPLLNISALCNKESSNIYDPWPEFTFYSSGSNALIAALQGLSIKKNTRILLPALICRSVPEKLSKHGYIPCYVDSAPDSPMFSANQLVESGKLDDVAALLLVDFFGFFSDDRNQAAHIAKTIGCAVIEDRCHSFFTRTEEVADAIIYSARKTLPVFGDGALWFPNSNKYKIMMSAAPVVYRDIRFIVYSMVERLVCFAGRPNIYSDRITKARQRQSVDSKYPNDLQAVDEILPVKLSWLLGRYLRNMSYVFQVIEKRRENYRRISRLIEYGGRLFDLSSSAVVPQAFPLLDPSGDLVDYLRSYGVGAYRWPGSELPQCIRDAPEVYPNAHRLNREIVCLPIHQSIGDHHIERMALLIDRFASAGG